MIMAEDEMTNEELIDFVCPYIVELAERGYKIETRPVKNEFIVRFFKES